MAAHASTILTMDAEQEAKNEYVHQCSLLREELRKYVGRPPPGNTGCSKAHGETKICDYCRFNECQACGSQKTVCPLCAAQGPCASACALFGKPRFTGFMGGCGSCPNAGSDVPDDWKKDMNDILAVVVPPPPPPPPAAVAPPPAAPTQQSGPVSITVIDSDDEKDDEEAAGAAAVKADEGGEPVKQRTFPLSIEEFTIPPSGRAEDFHLEEIYRTKVKLPQHADEIRWLAETIDAVKEKSSMSTDFIIKAAFRIQNVQTRELYQTGLKHIVRKNDQRPASEQVNPLYGLGFHGTNLESAKAIAEHGVKEGRTHVHVYGKGFYIGFDDMTVSSKYAFKDNDRIGAMVIGQAAVGRYCLVSDQNADMPLPGYDSGGNGTKNIVVLFSNYQFSSEYIIDVERASRADWKKQLARIRVYATSVLGKKVKPQAPSSSSSQPTLSAASGGPSSSFGSTAGPSSSSGSTAGASASAGPSSSSGSTAGAAASAGPPAGGQGSPAPSPASGKARKYTTPKGKGPAVPLPWSNSGGLAAAAVPAAAAAVVVPTAAAPASSSSSPAPSIPPKKPTKSKKTKPKDPAPAAAGASGTDPSGLPKPKKPRTKKAADQSDDDKTQSDDPQDEGEGGGSKYLPTPPTSEENSHDDDDDSADPTYKPALRK